jgi:hypothetical protein
MSRISNLALHPISKYPNFCNMLFKTASAFAALCFTTAALAAPSAHSSQSGIHGKKGVTGIRPAGNSTMLSAKAAVPITYHGGPIMTGTITGK